MLILSVAMASFATAGEPTEAEKALWQLEKDYWRYVQAGDVLVVQYAVEYVYDYGDGTKSGAGLWRKFTHTWKKTGDRWQIITGMCAAQEPVVAPRS